MDQGQLGKEPDEVTVRGLAPDDGSALSALYAQPSVVAGTLQMPHPPTHLWTDRAISPAPGIHQLVACSGKRVIGHLGLNLVKTARRRHSVSLGMAVDESFRGRGVGGALLDAAIDLGENWYGATRIELEVYVDNEPALRLYQSRGFEVEGVLRGFALRDGAYIDVYAMSRLRMPEGVRTVTARTVTGTPPPRG